MSNKVELSEIADYTETPISRIQPNSLLVRDVILEVKKALDNSLNEKLYYYKNNSPKILEGRRTVQKKSVGTKVAEFRIITDDVSRSGRLSRLSQILRDIKRLMFKVDVGPQSWKKDKRTNKFKTSAGGAASYEQLTTPYDTGTEIEIRFDKESSGTATSSGGKDPRLLLVFEAKVKNVQQRNKVTDIPFYFHILIDIKPRAEKIEVITPKKLNLTGKWFNIDDYVLSCKTGISSLNSPGRVKQYMNDLLDYFNPKNKSSTSTVVDRFGCYEYLSSESSEIFSPLHFIDDVQNISTRRKLGFPEDPNYSDLDKWFIFIPSSSNEELVDYLVFCGNKPTKTKDVDGAIKISVKNVSSSSGSTATVKFPTMFDNANEVKNWYSNLSSITKRKQEVQKIIAEKSVETKSTLYPLLALNEIMQVSKSTYDSFSRNQMRRVTPDEKDAFEQAVGIMTKRYSSIKYRYDALDDHITDEKILNKVKAVITKVILETAKDYKNYTDSLVNPLQPGVYLNEEQFKNVFAVFDINRNNKKSLNYPFAVNNLVLICERILADSTDRNYGYSYKNNFYKMFFDAVICKKMIIYSKSSYINGVFNFVNYGRNNFGASVNYWLRLRSKNYANNLQDALGIQT